MDSPVFTVLDSLRPDADEQLRQQARLELRGWLEDPERDHVSEFLAGIQPADSSPAQLQLLLGELLQWLKSNSGNSLPAPQLESLGQLAGATTAQAGTSQLILTLLASQADAVALRILVDLLVDSPPEDGTAIAAALATLVNGPEFNIDQLFPRLLDGLAHPQSAAAILDVANFLSREDRVESHPATGRREQLESLLHGINHRLEQLQELDDEPAGSVQQLHHQVADSVALAVSICDALACIGSDTSLPILKLVLQLPHRRLRTEAAAALAQLGDPDGQKVLLEMASEPVARLRVLRYAEELGISDQVAAEWTSPQAQGESELSLWLAQPENVGIPPTRMELADQRQLYWPGFEEPVDCFLFDFKYQFEGGIYSNRGIAGPITMAVHACLEQLPLDDSYALFAGWTAEHEEIQQWPADDVDSSLAVEMMELGELAEQQNFEDLKPLLVGTFFGETLLVSAASFEDRAGLVVIEKQHYQWWPAGHPERPLSPDDVLNIYKGTKLLATFND